MSPPTKSRCRSIQSEKAQGALHVISRPKQQQQARKRDWLQEEEEAEGAQTTKKTKMKRSNEKQKAGAPSVCST